jgi:hypothetical protein
MSRMVLLAALFAVPLADLRADDKVVLDRDRDPDKAYLPVKDRGGKTVYKLADEWVMAARFTGMVKPEDLVTIYVGDVRISPTVVPLAVSTPKRGLSKGGDPGFALMVAITGAQDAKKQECARWTKAKPRDDLKNEYSQVIFSELGPVESLGITGERTRFDGKTISDVLVFERPVRKAKEVLIELPGENVGLKSPIKIKVTAEAIAAADALNKLLEK